MNWECKDAREALRDGSRTGKIAGSAVLAAVALAGHLENGNAVAPLNAISHAVWGEEAFEQKSLSLKYTGAALLIHDSAMVSWGAIFQLLFGRKADRGEIGPTLGGAILVSVLAYVVDYKLAPPRFRPGIEHHLSPRALFAVYVVLAAALALGSVKKR
jgi:hypothetical protein